MPKPLRLEGQGTKPMNQKGQSYVQNMLMLTEVVVSVVVCKVTDWEINIKV